MLKVREEMNGNEMKREEINGKEMKNKWGEKAKRRMGKEKGCRENNEKAMVKE